MFIFQTALTLLLLVLFIVLLLREAPKSLTDIEILEELDKGNIILENWSMSLLNPNSVDITLGNEIRTYIDGVLDCKRENHTTSKIIDNDGYVLYPGRVYLFCCNEKIGVKKNIHARLIGKSSIGRLGLDIHKTAGFIDTGFYGSLVLELECAQPIRVYPNMPIGQIEFIRNSGNFLQTYDQNKNSKYMNQEGPQESLMHKNFK